MNFSFDAFVTEVLFDGETAAFALGDGRICWEEGDSIVAHDGAILAAAGHPSGQGVVSGGDDGRLAWTRRGVTETVCELTGAWIDALATSPVSGLIAFAAGRDVHVRDIANGAFERRFAHDKTVAAVAFDLKGRRLAAATYGGVALWWARIAEQRPVMMRWAGSHVAAAFGPDGRFLVSSMQENALHGWRIADGRDMRMGGYPAKVKSLVFVDGWLATAGANGVVLWPFSSADGPMGQQAAEIGFDGPGLVTRVAGEATAVVAGLDDGQVWACDLTSQARQPIRTGKGSPISALAVKSGRVAWGDEAGEAGVTALTSV